MQSFRPIVLRLTIAFWLVFKVMSPNLWWTWNRSFPELPIIQWLTHIPAQVSDVISSISVLIMIFALIKPKRILLGGVLAFELVLMSMDQMRWQPSIFQFVVTLALGLLDSKYFKTYFFVLLSATYMFSGLHKLNLGFINFIWGKLFLIEFLNIPSEIAFHRLTKAAGFVFPCIEILLGVIIWTKYRTSGWLLLIVMHFLLVLALGPLGINYNSIVWPWNILMMLFAFLYLKDNQTPFVAGFFKRLSFIILTALIGVLPLFSLLGLHSPYLSFALYGGKTDFLYVHLPKEYARKVNQKSMTFQGKEYIDVFEWSMQELNVPMVPYLPVFKDFKDHYQTEHGREAKFLIRRYPYKYENTLPFDD